MALKNFFSRETGVESEVAGMKIVLFTIFDPTWLDPHFDSKNAQIWNLLIRILIVNHL